MRTKKMVGILRLTALTVAYIALLFLTIENYNLVSLIEAKLEMKDVFSMSYVNMIGLSALMLPFYYQSIIYVFFDKE